MKKSKKLIAGITTVAVAIAGAALLPQKTPEEISIEAQIEQLQIEMQEKEERGEGLTITLQRINELKLLLK